MNKKVIKTMTILCLVFLVAFSLLKTVGAEWFAVTIQNENLIKIGAFIDSHIVATVVCDSLISLLSMHLYVCACFGELKLKPIDYIILSILAIAGNVVYIYSQIIASIINLFAMVVYPLIRKARLFKVVLMFILHAVSQLLILYVRGVPLYLVDTNYATQFILFFDGFIWLALFYLSFYLYKEVLLWERCFGYFSEIVRKKHLSKKSKKSKEKLPTDSQK